MGWRDVLNRKEPEDASENSLPYELPKLPKGAYDSFGSSDSGHIFKNEGRLMDLSILQKPRLVVAKPRIEARQIDLVIE